MKKLFKIIATLVGCVIAPVVSVFLSYSLDVTQIPHRDFLHSLRDENFLRQMNLQDLHVHISL